MRGAAGQPATAARPAEFGLDTAGVITEVGDEVEGIGVGDRVYVNPGLSCGACRACREDQTATTTRSWASSPSARAGSGCSTRNPYGGHAEHLTAPARNLVVLPETISFEHGARFGYLGTAYSALRKGGGMMEKPGLDLFAMMCSQNSVIGSLWFSTGEAQEMAELAGAGVLDLSVFEHHVFPLENINEERTTSPSATAASATSSPR